MAPYAHAEEFTPKYLAYLPKLRNIVRRMLTKHSSADVEDVLQDVWIKGALYYSPGRVSHFKTWLGEIAKNASLRFLLDSSRMRSFELPMLGRRSDAADTAPDPEELAQHLEVASILGRALEQLYPSELRNVKLVHVDGLSYKETARVLGIAVGSAKSNTHKGIRHLRDILMTPKAT